MTRRQLLRADTLEDAQVLAEPDEGEIVGSILASTHELAFDDRAGTRAIFVLKEGQLRSTQKTSQYCRRSSKEESWLR